MILLCGIPSEAPIARVRGALDTLAVPYVEFNQRRFDDVDLWFEIAARRLGGELRIGKDRYALEHFTGVYTRLMDDRLLPELRDEPPASPRRRHCRAVHDAILHWMEITPARVLNRTEPMTSNGSKPLQAQLIRRHGFAVPDTLVTSDPEAVVRFRAEKGRIVYKSVSGLRSIVREFLDQDAERLDRIRWCPVQFQEFVSGTDVRVHVVGNQVFATRVASGATDYRYAGREGQPAQLTAHEMADNVAARCVHLATALRLPFAGIDLRFAPDGRIFCFEVNPSPGFSYYESNTGQPIAMAVAKHLAGLA